MDFGPLSVEQIGNEDRLQPSVIKYCFAAESFILDHSGTCLFGYRGALTKVDDILVRFRSDLIQCMCSEQEAHHIPACP